jgi:hypothetical protein
MLAAAGFACSMASSRLASSRSAPVDTVDTIEEAEGGAAAPASTIRGAHSTTARRAAPRGGGGGGAIHPSPGGR